MLLNAVDAYQCPGDENLPLPDSPVFTSNNVSDNEYPVLENGINVIKDHWSEIVSPFRPPSIVPVSNPSQTDCPHLQGTLLNWHDASTWTGNVIPVSGNDVTIPSNTRVLISSCSINSNDVYGIITIPATSELIFNDIVDISLRAKGFRVLGKLRAGSTTCRLRNKIKITLHGKRTDQNLPTDPWVKGIYAENGGIIDLHGVQYFPTWTRLALSGKIGDSNIFVQDLVNWEVGQTILITTTELKDSRDFNRNELRVISGIARAPNFSGTTTRITLDRPLTYLHYGGSEYQAEVALLSRRIIVQGDENDSEPPGYTDINVITCKDSDSESTYPCQTETLHSGFGGHIQIAGTGSIGRASGIELFRMGQTNVVGRYPFHFHLIESSPASFIQDSSIHRSFFRCIAVHGTNDVKISQNVAYDAIGHCYYLEDGVEENNLFEYNLGSHVHFIGPAHLTSSEKFGSWWSQSIPWLDESSTQVLPADISASPFYITSAFNSFIGNAASGGWSGFAFPNLPKPVKLFKSQTTTVSARPLKKFQGNSAHSTGYWFNSASGIYVGGTLKHKTGSDALTYTFGRDGSRDTCLDDPRLSENWCLYARFSWMIFEDTKVFLINGRGFQHWGSRSEIHRYESHDAGLSGNYFGAVYLNQMLVNCRSNHKPTFMSGCKVKNEEYYKCSVRDYQFWQTFAGFQWYDVGQHHIITNSTFRNCNANWNGPCIWGCEDVSVWIFLTHSDEFVPEVMQATRNIKYENVDPSNLFLFSTKKTAPEGITVSGRLQSWHDVDGSASMSTTKRRTQIGSDWAGDSWWRLNSNCEHREELYVCPMADADTSASVTFIHDPKSQKMIGKKICVNGFHKGKKKCPIIGKATHFGRSINEGLSIGSNARVTGPVIASSGGWFVRFNTGTPKVLELKEFQVARSTKLLLALPYPSGTTFKITAYAANWCWKNCSFKFKLVDSLGKVIDSSGAYYYFDSSKGILYLKLVQQPDRSLGDKSPWELLPLYTFERDGISLPYLGWEYRLKIEAINCGGSSKYCTQPPLYVSPAMNLS